MSYILFEYEVYNIYIEQREIKKKCYNVMCVRYHLIRIYVYCIVP